MPLKAAYWTDTTATSVICMHDSTCMIMPVMFNLIAKQQLSCNNMHNHTQR